MPTRPAWRQIFAVRNRKRNRAMAKVVCLSSATFAVSSRWNNRSQHEVVGQHGQLKMYAVGGPAPGRMGRQSGIVVGLFNEVLSAGTLIVEPHQQVNGALHVGDEDPIDILRAVEQLVLLARGGGLLLLWITQGNKTAGLFPAFRVIPELALLVGVGAGRRPPMCALQLRQ